MHGRTTIQIEDLWKQYRLGVISHGTLYRDLQSWWARLRGRPDPNAVVEYGGAEAAVRANAEFFWALRGINFEVREGEVLGVIGRNGAGKSTLLKLLSRITAPTRGAMRMRGRVASLLEVGTGFHPELTGKENVYLNGAILGMTRREIRARFDEIVDFSGVGPFIETPVKRYSSGMRVRLAFAVAAHLDPEILLIDEVLAVGDAAFQKKCLGKMNEVSREQGRTVLFVSHNMGAILNICSRCLFLNQGELMLDAPPEDAVEQYLNSSFQTSRRWTSKGKNRRPLQILECRVLSSSGSPIEELDVRKGVRIEADYVVRERIYGATVAINVHASDGSHLLSLEDIDQNPELRDARTPGVYTAAVEIPGLWLNQGRYYIRIGCGLAGTEVFEDHEALGFDLIETGDASARSHRAGHLLPMLPWTIRKKAEADQSV